MTDLNSHGTSKPPLGILRSFGRLHFGLMEICPGQPHCYGGVGIMLNHPATHLEFAIQSVPIEQLVIDASPYWRERIHAHVKRWMNCHTSSHSPVAWIRSSSLPTPHQGLGSGTQVACSIATLLQYSSRLHRQSHRSEMELVRVSQIWHGALPAIESLKQHTGRGKRSHIGLAGFLSGGLVVDRGEHSVSASLGLEPSEMRTRAISFPEEWPIVLVHGGGSPGEYGDDESRMFEQCSSQPNSNRARMMELLERDLLQAIEQKNWSNASSTIGAYGELAGQVFFSAQGGIYRTDQIEATVRSMRECGMSGSGQSSWGPTVFGLSSDPDHATWCAAQLQRKHPDAMVRIVAARNEPAEIDCSIALGSTGNR